MDRFLAPNSTEALAHLHLTENAQWFAWDELHPDLEESMLAGLAAYQAFSRYLSGATELYVVPRNKSDLKRVLSRYAQDAIHNAISLRRGQPLETGGYSRICSLAEASIKKATDCSDNVAFLLDMHNNPVETIDERPHNRSVRSS